jgi:hypothetical protein
MSPPIPATTSQESRTWSHRRHGVAAVSALLGSESRRRADLSAACGHDEVDAPTGWSGHTHRVRDGAHALVVTSSHGTANNTLPSTSVG